MSFGRHWLRCDCMRNTNLPVVLSLERKKIANMVSVAMLNEWPSRYLTKWLLWLMGGLLMMSTVQDCQMTISQLCRAPNLLHISIGTCQVLL